MPTIEQLNAMADVGNPRALFQQPQSQPQKKKDNGLLSFLPSAAAAAASFIPGVGTIAGGLIGGAGEAGRQLLSGENFDLGKVGQEAALSAIPFGIGKAGKIAGAVKNATKGGAGLGGTAKAVGEAIAPISTARSATNTSSAIDAFNNTRVSQALGQVRAPSDLGRIGIMGADSSAKAAADLINANQTRLGSLGKNAIGLGQRAERSSVSTQVADAERFNDLASQNIRNLAQERAQMGLPLANNGGVLVKAGQAPSFASEGVERIPVPKIPELNPRYKGLSNAPNPEPSQTLLSIIQKPNTESVSRFSSPEGAATTGQSTPSLINKFKTSAQNKSQEGMGLTVGQSVGRGKVLTPDKATAQYDFITNGAQKYGGIRAGKPIDQARDAQNVHNNVAGALDKSLDKINRPLIPQEVQSIGNSVAQKIASNALITGKSSTTAQKLLSELQSATDLKSLEAIRRKADDVAFTQSGAGKTSAAAQAHSVRDAIDEFITPLSAEYKAIKGDYVASKDALDSLSKANKNAKGVKVPLVDIEVGKQGISGAVNKGAAIVSGAQGNSLVDKFKKGAQFTGELAKQGAARVVAGPVIAPEQAPEENVDPSTALGLTPSQPASSAPQDTGGISQQQLMAAVAADPKNADTYITLYKLFNDQKTTKPLSAESAKTLSNAQTGLTALDQIEGQLADDPSIQQRGGISGAFNPFGLVSGALGTGEYENARAQARDIIARIRTGAALTADEAKAFDKFLPQPGDSKETVQQKIGGLRSQFQYIVENAGGAGTDLSQGIR